MRPFKRSLRRKVLLGYLMGFMLMLAVIGINWNNLGNVEGMVLAGAKVADLFDTALEIRRFEKNYFLYETDADYQELLRYLEKARALLDENRGDYVLFSGTAVISGLERDITKYGEVLRSARTLNDPKLRVPWEKELRELGREIVVATGNIAETERQTMHRTLKLSRNVSLLSMIFLVSAGFVVGATFYRMFIKPPSLLENHMEDIAEGEFSLTPLESKDRELVSLNRMLMELEAKQRRLVQSEKLASLGTLLFGVAHELNNPLSNISTSCQMLHEEIGDADMEHTKELLVQIEEETYRAKDIVRSLLDFSRGKERETMNLKQTVNDTIRLIKAEVPTKVEISVSIPDDLTLFADKQKIQQAFLNLIQNSVAAIPDEGVISISAKNNSREGVVEIRVSDTGVGMEPGVLSKIFNPFFTTKGSRSGYGLGLFIVHNTVQEHDGSIVAESEPGHGTVFLIKIPERSEHDGR